MNWKVEFTDIALKTLKKMDKHTAAMLIGYIEKKLVGSINPRSLGKPLIANHKGKWRYRIGEYRLLCLIEDDRITITVIQIGHRKEIYKRQL
ncbi:MAG: type II toxin-antitoxin system mRNA interferase toxin, RelE/StbE family [Firmicutes bacterium HGW-Firmicutes-7]|nr:MAG: type II toxin-antitoxin system mRNA interferase toxin, RelE/StbE family [Firmicutes bacterium HGW-Firmicutes-7]